MEESFELPVIYKNTEVFLPAEFRQLGYTYKIYIDVNGEELVFERDENRNWRALLDPDRVAATRIDHAMLEAIAEALDTLLK